MLIFQSFYMLLRISDLRFNGVRWCFEKYAFLSKKAYFWAFITYKVSTRNIYSYARNIYSYAHNYNVSLKNTIF